VHGARTRLDNTIGVSNASQFDALESLRSEAKDCDSLGLFLLPSLTTAKIGDATSSVGSSNPTSTKLAAEC